MKPAWNFLLQNYSSGQFKSCTRIMDPNHRMLDLDESQDAIMNTKKVKLSEPFLVNVSILPQIKFSTNFSLGH